MDWRTSWPVGICRTWWPWASVSQFVGRTQGQKTMPRAHPGYGSERSQLELGSKRPHTLCEVEWQVPIVHTQLPRRLPGKSLSQALTLHRGGKLQSPPRLHNLKERLEFLARIHTIWEIQKPQAENVIQSALKYLVPSGSRQKPMCNFYGGALLQPRSPRNPTKFRGVCALIPKS